MPTRINTGQQNAALDGCLSPFNNGTAEVRVGTQPASANDAATGALLATITLPATAFNSAASGQATKNGTWSVNATAGGVAGYLRLISPTPFTHVRDVPIIEAAGADRAVINSATIVLGGLVTITAYTVTQPGG